MSRGRNRSRFVLGVTAGVSFVAAGAATDARATTFTTAYTDGGTWNTIYAQGFSPALTPNPDPALQPGDAVQLTQFQFFKSGTADSASNIRLAILNNIYANLQGLTTSSTAVVGLSSNTVAGTGSIATGAPITFDFANLALTYGSDYGAVLVNVGGAGELTPVLVSALTANYTDRGGGDYHPTTNYGTETQYQYAVSNYITTNQYGQFFNAFSYSGDANFVASLTTPAAAGSTWNLSGSGDWSAAGSWTGGVPNAPGASATFGAAATSDATVNVDVNVSVGALAFDNASHSYTLGGTGTITLDSTGGAATVTAAGGSHTIAAPLALADDTTVTVTPAGSVLTLSNLASSAVTLTKAGAGTLAVNAVRANGLVIGAGTVQVTANGSAAGASNVASLSVAAGAKLDLTNNKLIVGGGNTGTWTGSGYDGIAGLVATARGDGTWNGPSGITTSGASGKLTTLAVASAGDIKGPGGGTWAGQSVSATDTLVMFTYGGDANMDGKINIDDYGRIDGHVGQNGSVFGWFNGDFNYDGHINIDDYGIIDGNIGAQGAPFSTAGGAVSGVTAVPEPVTPLALSVAAMCGSLGRRRRSHGRLCACR